jgi:hypothetical protein
MASAVDFQPSYSAKFGHQLLEKNFEEVWAAFGINWCYDSQYAQLSFYVAVKNDNIVSYLI